MVAPHVRCQIGGMEDLGLGSLSGSVVLFGVERGWYYHVRHSAMRRYSSQPEHLSTA